MVKSDLSELAVRLVSYEDDILSAELDLSNCLITNVGVQIFSPSLSHFKSLQRLKIILENNDLSDEGVSVLWKQINRLNNLTELNADLSYN